jgi:multidrug efflux pump subunit AcrA (membrane-fusion protein)
MRSGLIFCGLLIALTMLLSGCASSVIEASEGPELLEPVGFAVTALDTAVVSRGVVEQLYVRHGVVRVESVSVAFDVSGRLLNVYVSEGEYVSEGQILARLDLEALIEEIERQEELLAEVIRTAEISDEIFSLQTALRQIDYTEAMRRAAETLDAQAMQNAENILLEIERSEMLHAQAAEMRGLDIADIRRGINELRRGLESTELFAPFSGTVTAFANRQGNQISEGRPFLYINNSPYVFVEDVDPEMHTRIRNAPRIQGRINGLVYDLELVPMTMEELAQARRASLPVRWRLEITPQPDGTMPPLGAYVSIIYSVIYEPDTLRVPVNAVRFDRDTGDHVYLMQDGYRVQTFVRTGVSTDSFAEILEGLQEGDVVLVD